MKSYFFKLASIGRHLCSLERIYFRAANYGWIIHRNDRFEKHSVSGVTLLNRLTLFIFRTKVRGIYHLSSSINYYSSPLCFSTTSCFTFHFVENNFLNNCRGDGLKRSSFFRASSNFTDLTLFIRRVQFIQDNFMFYLTAFSTAVSFNHS